MLNYRGLIVDLKVRECVCTALVAEEKRIALRKIP